MPRRDNAAAVRLARRLDTHELTAEAVATCDLMLVRRALLTDPLVTSLADAEAILRDLLVAELDALPDCWYS